MHVITCSYLIKGKLEHLSQQPSQYADSWKRLLRAQVSNHVHLYQDKRQVLARCKLLFNHYYRLEVCTI